jgi:hypothetical protein
LDGQLLRVLRSGLIVADHLWREKRVAVRFLGFWGFFERFWIFEEFLEIFGKLVDF